MATVFFPHSSSVHLRPGGTLEAAAMAGSEVKLVGGTGQNSSKQGELEHVKVTAQTRVWIRIGGKAVQKMGLWGWPIFKPHDQPF